MNKNAIKSFAIDARNWLRDKIETKLGEFGITEEGISGVYAQTDTEVRVTDLSAPINKIQYENLKKYATSLKKSYGDNWYNELVEESAYIWFNRIVGIKYMEVNGYLPENINILTSTTGRVEPDIVISYEYLGYADTLDKNFIRNGVLNHDIEGVFRYLFLMENHQLSKIMPFMFATENDFSDLVFPDNILAETGIINKINNSIPQEDWQEIEIIGWLYQYYNTANNELVYDGSMKKEKLPKELIPAATQIFTPKWVVKYMVENSLGKLALEELGVRESIKENWKYYIEAEGMGVINNARTEGMKIEEVKILDPSMGSGHILVYAFDVLYQIYEELGYSRREAVASIINNNLYGMDIDDRAATLASFALVMKGREYFPRVFSLIANEEIELNTLSIQESNSLEEGITESIQGYNYLELLKLIALFNDAKEYGSILKIEGIDFNKAEEEFISFEHKEALFYEEEKKLIRTLIKQAKIMSQKYDVTVTNPPYLSSSRMNGKLGIYTNSNYPETKADFSMMFYQRAIEEFCKKNGYISFITTNSWMFLKSFEGFRKKIINNLEFENLVDFGSELFDGKVGHNLIVAWVNKNTKPTKNLKAIRLVEFCYSRRDEKEKEFYNTKNHYTTPQQDFHKIPGSPIAYWISDRVKEIFENNKKILDITNPRKGLVTGDNNKFTRLWNEVDNSRIGFRIKNREQCIESKKRWFPYNKGGDYRKWYGNYDYIVNWENDGYLMRNTLHPSGERPISSNYNLEFIFKPLITWSAISSKGFSSRICSEGTICDAGGSACYPTEEYIVYLISLLNTKITSFNLFLMNPTLNFQAGNIASLPVVFPLSFKVKEKINNLTNECIFISREEWNSRETSWDFTKNQLAGSSEQVAIKEAYNKYCEYWTEKIHEMHKNEEDLNRLFIEIYGLQDEMVPEIDLKEITILKKELLRQSTKKATEVEEAEEAGLILDDKGEIQFNREEVIKQFISYGIGCNMGRYSIDKEGLIMANSDDKLIIENEQLKIVGADSISDQRHIISNPRYTPDDDGIIPVTDTNYFAGEDVVERFEEFLAAVYGKETLEDNLKFIAEAIKDSKNEPREVLREYFMGDFYADHLQRYTDSTGKNKRPIYWLVSSNGKGKGAAFNAYIYLHRYNKNTIPTIRGRYVNELQAKLKSKEDLIEKTLLDDNLSIKEKKELKDEKDKYRKQLNELLEFDKKLNTLSNQMIELDLDDGVKVNYGKLAEILYRVKM